MPMKLAQGHTTPGRLTPMSDSRETLSLFHRTVKQGGHKAPLVGVETCFAWGESCLPTQKEFHLLMSRWPRNSFKPVPSYLITQSISSTT